MNQDVIENAIAKILAKIKVPEEIYQEYVKYVDSKVDEIIKSNQEQKRIIDMRIWAIEKEKREYMKRNMWVATREDEKKLYNDTLEEFDAKIETFKKEVDNISSDERNKIMEFDIMTKLLDKADKIYENSSSVRKKKICKILTPNIYIDNKKRLTIEVNPALRGILDTNLTWSRDWGNWTPDAELWRLPLYHWAKSLSRY